MLNISTRVWVLHIPNFGQNVLLHVFGPFCKILCKMKNKMMQKAHNFGLCPNASTLENDKKTSFQISFMQMFKYQCHMPCYFQEKRKESVCTHSFWRIFCLSFLFYLSHARCYSPSFLRNTSPKLLTLLFFNMHAWHHPGRAKKPLHAVNFDTQVYYFRFRSNVSVLDLDFLVGLGLETTKVGLYP